MIEKTFRYSHVVASEIEQWLRDSGISVGVSTDQYESAADFEQRIQNALDRLGKKIEITRIITTRELRVKVSP